MVKNRHLLQFASFDFPFPAQKSVTVRWHGDGLAIWHKRLEEGTFSLPMVEEDVTGVTLSGADLTLLLQGLDLKIARRRKRYRCPA